MLNLVFQSLTLIFICSQSDGASDWSYSGEHGPGHWKDNYAACGYSKQSPINFEPSSLTTKSNLGQFTFGNYDHVPAAGSFSIFNNGHTVQVNIKSEADVELEGGGLGAAYQLAQFHMHWGGDDCKGSEHTISHRSYPIEIHLVHFNKKYGNLSAAVSMPDGLAVIGFFGEVGDKTHAGFEKITSKLSEVKTPSGEKPLASFRLDELLPSNKADFLRYNGSLTTPPCYESVTWTVLRDTVKLSEAQLKSFRSVSYSTEKHEPLVNNYRPTMPLSGRTVYKTFSETLAPPPTPTSTCGAPTLLPHALSILLIIAAKLLFL
jgi:carbonic anhydrase